ncbi:hypothetical protein BV22DRAFT_1132194 [Leucogyrophana mollusca]|uniref:Uncharacterized protein n=1 Tax=Leucogyrophana mollusca TaxID=85980 RepID=A0ACB8B6T8_9AGAM|nr:hypothetical protein BV22DRAFT_1132194 [Leucogyrophana mollusca]
MQPLRNSQLPDPGPSEPASPPTLVPLIRNPHSPFRSQPFVCPPPSVQPAPPACATPTPPPDLHPFPLPPRNLHLPYFPPPCRPSNLHSPNAHANAHRERRYDGGGGDGRDVGGGGGACEHGTEGGGEYG